MPDDRGRWIKVYEKLVDSPMWQKLPGEQCKAWVGFMVKVNWRDGVFYCRQCRREISVPPGGTTKSYNTLADLAHVNSGVMKRLLKALCQDGFLENRSRPRCHTLYIVRNWEFFQGDGDDRDLTMTPVVRPSIGDPRNAVLGVTGDPVIQKQNIEIETDSIILADPSMKEASETADLLRSLCLETGLPCRRFKDDLSWFQVKGSWVTVLAPLIHKHGSQMEKMRQAFKASGWKGKDGSTWTWARTIARAAHPPSKWADKYETIVDKLEEKPLSVVEGYIPFDKLTLPAGYDSWQDFATREIDERSIVSGNIVEHRPGYRLPPILCEQWLKKIREWK